MKMEKKKIREPTSFNNNPQHQTVRCVKRCQWLQGSSKCSTWKTTTGFGDCIVWRVRFHRSQRTGHWRSVRRAQVVSCAFSYGSNTSPSWTRTSKEPTSRTSAGKRTHLCWKTQTRTCFSMISHVSARVRVYDTERGRGREQEEDRSPISLPGPACDRAFCPFILPFSRPGTRAYTHFRHAHNMRTYAPLVPYSPFRRIP